MTDITRAKLTYKIPIPNYTFGEELVNTLSHGIGALLGISALVLCIVRASLHGSGSAIASGLVFGLSLIILYAMSATYHGVRPGIAKRILRICDHCTIFVLIAGSYTPFTLITLHGRTGYTLFGIIWAMAVIGILLNAIDLERFKGISMVCYLVMGWCVVFTFPELRSNLQHAGLLLLIWGGIAYTVGAIIFGIGSKLKYMHSLWHFFVLAGSILHFLCIYMYVL
ncbi:hemolysin III [Lachnospiraceae bacterium XBB1006]|nr:hemolysin III [Lachnospiraceae bacterium XBB1006]